jgi:hypothetical protein
VSPCWGIPANIAAIAAGPLIGVDDVVVVGVIPVDGVVPVVDVSVVSALAGLFPELWPRTAAAIAPTTATTITAPSSWMRRARFMVTACRSRRNPE